MLDTGNGKSQHCHQWLLSLLVEMVYSENSLFVDCVVQAGDVVVTMSNPGDQWHEY